MQDFITVSCSALPDSAGVIGVHGVEAISRPYAFAIDLLIAHTADVALDDVDGEKISLTFDRGDGRPPLRVHGIVAGLDLLHDVGSGGIWRLHLAPRLWQLSLNRRSCIFVDETVPKIVEKVLQRAGLEAADYAIRLAGSYPTRDHVCQYQESDLAFISRSMERDGLYYFFEQLDDHERLVITDSSSFAQDFSSDAVRYVPEVGAESAFRRGEAFGNLVCRRSRVASAVRLDEYDYMRPDLDVTGKAPVATRGFGEVRLFGENFTTSDEGKRLAKVRAQEILASKSVYSASGNVPYLRSGYLFALDEHPRASFNMKYLVTEIHHVANQAAHAMKLEELLDYPSDEVYRSQVTAIPADIQYRAPRVTPIPRVDGVLAAEVDGAADSDYAQIDKEGRYKVWVMLDETDTPDGKASTFVRMLQPHGGSPEGFHFPLRKGTEVLLVFLGGDPDRPVIAGVAPNAKNPSPISGDSHTKNVIHTGGGTRLEIEDAEGRQYVKWTTPHKNTMFHLGTPHNPTAAIYSGTDGSCVDTFGEDWHVDVGKTLQQDIQGYTGQRYHDTREEVTMGYFHQDIQSGFLQTIKGGSDEEITGTYTQRVHGFHKQEIDDGLSQTIKGFYEQKAQAGAKQTVTGEYERHVTGNLNEKIDGYVNQHVGEKKVYSKGNSVKVTLGMTDETMIGVKQSNFVGGQLNLTVGLKADLNLSVAKTLTLAKEDNTLISRSTTAATFSKNELAITLNNFGKSSTRVSLTEELVAVKKGESFIFSAAFAVFK